MTGLSEVRGSEFAQVREAIRSWSSVEEAVVGVALVGSWALGRADMDSDVDVVVVTTSDRYVRTKDWIAGALGRAADLVRTGDWGALVERRVRLRSGLEIEFGFVPPSWAAVEPVDPGTRRVVSDGCQVWYDPQGLLALLLDAVR